MGTTVGLWGELGRGGPGRGSQGPLHPPLAPRGWVMVLAVPHGPECPGSPLWRFHLISLTMQQVRAHSSICL